MTRIEESAFLIMLGGLMWPTAVLAEETATAPSRGYGGADSMWFAAIGIVLAYGVYDTFFKAP